MGVSEAMTHIVQMQLEKMNPAILDTFKRTMQLEDLSARSNALQSMVTQFNLGKCSAMRKQWNSWHLCWRIWKSIAS